MYGYKIVGIFFFGKMIFFCVIFMIFEKKGMELVLVYLEIKLICFFINNIYFDSNQEYMFLIDIFNNLLIYLKGFEKIWGKNVLKDEYDQ